MTRRRRIAGASLPEPREQGTFVNAKIIDSQACDLVACPE